jgi:hypothetical protein
MTDRLEQLQRWGLTAPLLRLADGDLPHPAFESRCEPIRYDERREFGLNLDRVEARDETSGHVSAALWEHDVGYGHAFEVVYCAEAKGGVEFWHVMYADDTDGPQPERIAKSEQGLFYWLFFSLIQSEFFSRGERAYSNLAEAAKSVGFEHLVDVFRLEEEIGSDYERRGELTEQSLSIGGPAAG